MMLLGDDEPPTRWRVSFKAELTRVNAALKLAGIDTEQPLSPPSLDSGNVDDDGDDASRMGE